MCINREKGLGGRAYMIPVDAKLWAQGIDSMKKNVASPQSSPFQIECFFIVNGSIIIE